LNEDERLARAIVVVIVAVPVPAARLHGARQCDAEAGGQRRLE